VPFFRGKEISEKFNGAQTLSTELFISRQRFEEIASKFGAPREGDLLLTSVGTLGVPYLVRPSDEFYFKDGNLTWFREFRGISSAYLYYWLLSPPGRAQLGKSTIGTSQAAYTIELLKRMTICVPPPAVQNATVSVLSAYDDLIENNRRRMALLEEAPRQLYREWFVRLRFPGHEHTSITDGVPEGWEQAKVGDLLAKVESRKKIPKDAYLPEGPIPCVDQSADFIGGFTDDEEALYATPLPVVVFGDHTRAVKFVNFPFARGADGTQVIYPSTKRISSEYLYLALRETDLSNYFYARHFKFLKEKQVLLPESSLVREFTVFAKACLDQIQTLRLQCQKLRSARDLLLPRLMTGEIAV